MFPCVFHVALHTEGVDWNTLIYIFMSKHYGRPPHGGCGLKSIAICKFVPAVCRPPHGGCGLKCFRKCCISCVIGRPPHGGCGLKSNKLVKQIKGKCGRPPHGGCGLKCCCFLIICMYKSVALHTEGVDWNGRVLIINSSLSCRPPHGGCGLKFWLNKLPYYISCVALHTEGVDWNCSSSSKVSQ